MYKLFVAILFFCISTCISAQRLSQVTFRDATNFSYYSFLCDYDVLIRVTDEGRIIEWGIERRAERFDYYDPKLQPYMGRIEYYTQDEDSAYRGKIKSIGTCVFTYYNHYETDIKVGKLRSIGNILLDYYTQYDSPDFKGKLRFIGTRIVEYYSAFDDEAFRGKIKSIGSTPIKYYSTFEDKLIEGKIKSIGSIVYTWYSSFDRSDQRGALKSGFYRQNIGDVTYILHQ
jgi:hypothetical protein